MALAKSQRSLKAWGRQKWRTKSGKKSSVTGERYLQVQRSEVYLLQNMQELLLQREEINVKVNSIANNQKVLQVR